MSNICIIPICGSASRIGYIPKFLLPIDNSQSLLKQSLEKAISQNFRVIIITNINLITLIYTYINSQYHEYLDKIKIMVTNTKTMSETILHFDFVNKNDIYSIIMPDTYIENSNFFNKMINIYHKYKCDIVVGIFKIEERQKGNLGQVKFDDENNLIDVVDKDIDCDYKWFWGCIIWNYKFFKFMDKKKSHIGYGLVPALKAKLNIKVCPIEGRYFDCGIINEYKLLLNNI